MSRILLQLRKDHENQAALLDLLERQIVSFGRGERTDYEIVKGVLDYCLSYPEQCHHPREDKVYAMLRRRKPDLADAIGQLVSEHDELAALTRGVSYAVAQVLADTDMPRRWFGTVALRFVRTYRDHMGREDGDLFPAAEESLSRQDWLEIEAATPDADDPLFGDRVEKRFESLRDHLLLLDRLVRQA